MVDEEDLDGCSLQIDSNEPVYSEVVQSNHKVPPEEQQAPDNVIVSGQLYIPIPPSMPMLALPAMPSAVDGSSPVSLLRTSLRGAFIGNVLVYESTMVNVNLTGIDKKVHNTVRSKN